MDITSQILDEMRVIGALFGRVDEAMRAIKVQSALDDVQNSVYVKERSAKKAVRRLELEVCRKERNVPVVEAELEELRKNVAEKRAEVIRLEEEIERCEREIADKTDMAERLILRQMQLYAREQELEEMKREEEADPANITANKLLQSYQGMTGVTWDCLSSRIRGSAFGGAGFKRRINFDLSPTADAFALANELWDIVSAVNQEK